MPPGHKHREMKEVLEDNNRLIAENNQLLKKLHRNARWSFWIRIVWYLLLFGLPFALYFYILEPYFELLGSSYEQFSNGMAEIPGWKQFNLMMDSIMNGGETTPPSDFEPVE